MSFVYPISLIAIVTLSATILLSVNGYIVILRYITFCRI